MLYFVSEAWGLSSCCPVSPPGLGSAVVPWMGLSSAPFLQMQAGILYA
jgi:hypothetical protein